MTKNIIVVCEQSHIDEPLRRSLAHLVKSCEITIVHSGHQFFDAFLANSFDLIIVDFELPEGDSLELVESVQYVDLGVPVILMLEQTHKAIWDTARNLRLILLFAPLNRSSSCVW